MIQVKVDQIFLSNMGFVVMLKNPEDDRSLPIFIGAAEAQAIALRMNDVNVPRPLTHDLLKNVLDFLECRLLRIHVCDLKEGTFYAKLILVRDGTELEMDSRPSDAIALALRFSAPIYVSDTVMAEAGRVFSELEQEVTAKSESGSSPKNRKKTSMTPVDALKADLEKAIEDERYEEAARLRDELKRLEGAGSEN